jgi:hypothetical protein
MSADKITMLRRACVAGILGLCAFLLFAAPALADPVLEVTSSHTPARIVGGGSSQFAIGVSNVGDSSTTGPISVELSLPAGLRATSVSDQIKEALEVPVWSCSIAPGGQSVACTGPEVFGSPRPIPPGEEACLNIFSQSCRILVTVVAEPGLVGPPTLTPALEACGGGAAQCVTATAPIVLRPPGFGFEGFSAAAENAAGTPATQAASHPYDFKTELNFNETDGPTGEAIPDGAIRDAHVALPPGLIGNPTAVARCTQAQFVNKPLNNNAPGTTECPDSSAIGTAVVRFPGKEVQLPVFNLVPQPGVPAEFGFNFFNVPIPLTPHLRPDGTYGLTVDSLDTSETLSVFGAKITIWGVPYSHAHDEERGSCLPTRIGGPSLGSCPINGAQQAYLTLPASCGGPQTTTISADSWQDPGSYLLDGEPDLSDLAWQTATSDPLGLNGCNRVPFTPTIAARPTTNQTTAATGLEFGIDFEDKGLTNPEGIAQSEIKKAVVTLPEGFTVNPSAGAGLTACSLPTYEALGLHSGAECPESSKIGDVEIDSPLVEEAVDGSLYVARQTENPFGNLLTIYLVARNAKLGLLIKQALKVEANPTTGQLTTTVDEVPQLPFSHFELSFKQGQTSPLVSPPACGEYTAKAELYPWSNPEVALHDSSSFRITAGTSGGPCPSGGVPPFHPDLLAGSENPTAGVYSPFYTDITRKDSEQEITRFSIKLPTGMIAKLKGVSECSDAQVAAAKAREHEGGGAEEEATPSCPANSLIGHSDVGAGVGDLLAYVPGRLYLAGPYHGSPISLVSITAAKVGPFDLGTVVVRFALDVNHETAEVSVDGAASDPIPHIIDGIPVHLRDIQATVDRPDFTLNPTSCAKKSTASTILGSGSNFASSSDDVPVTVSSPFQVASCASLGFKPKLALTLTGKKTHRGALPAFKAVLTYPKGGAYANIAKAQVTLPGSEFLEQGHLKNVCTRKVFETGANPGENCPANSIYGKARAVTPLLDQPLEGPVYLRTGYGTRLPELAAALNGPQISITLAGTIDSVHQKGTEGSRIRNTFAVVPDAPVEKFTLELKGGKKGLLVNSTDVCKGTHKALAAFTGQNGKLDEYEPALKAQCGKSSGKGKSAGKKKSGGKKKNKGGKGR